MTNTAKRSFFFVLLILVSMLAPLLITKTASAKGESYRYDGSNVIGSGGSYAHPVTFSLNNDGTFKSKPLTSGDFKSGLFLCAGTFVIYNVNGGSAKIKNNDTAGSCGSAQLDTDIKVSGAVPPGAGTGLDASGHPIGSNSSSDTNPTCETNGNPMTWILCPIFNGIADFSDWMFKNIVEPFLYTTPISTNADDPSFQVWSTFRVYGNIFLIIAMLVIVFGQAVGGGVIDAYTAKKVLPRILVAAILINLSVYIVALLVDVTNVAGKGIGDLLLFPFKSNSDFAFSPNGVQGVGVFSVGILGLILSGGTIAGILGALFFGGGAFIQVALFAALMAAIPVLLAILGVFVTLIIRKGLILFLVLVSPVAFALYCLPNTEKYFRKWWDLLFKALLVYPIVIVIFAIADILSITILKANGIKSSGLGSAQTYANGGGNVLAVIIAFVLQFLPLALIPFSFRFAGGAIGAIHGAFSSGSGKINTFAKNRRERAQLNLRRQMVQSRGRSYNRLGAAGDASSGLRRRGFRFLQGRVGGRNIHADMAELQAIQNKEFEAQKATGIDDEQRAFTVNKQWALDAQNGPEGKHWRNKRDAAGNITGREFRTLGGRWVSESAVDAAHGRDDWKGNQHMMQSAVAYEMQKAGTQEEMDYLYQNYGRLNQPGNGFNLSDGEMGGMWTGAAFSQQNTDRQWKHYKWNDGQLQADGLTLMREVDERQGSWQMASQSADTWTTMSEEVNRARRVRDGSATAEEQRNMTGQDAEEIIQRGARIARSMSGGYRDENGQYHSEVGQGASGRTREEMRNFSNLFAGPGGTLRDYTEEVGTARRAGTDTSTGVSRDTARTGVDRIPDENKDIDQNRPMRPRG